jgi:replicative DNA helicase
MTPTASLQPSGRSDGRVPPYNLEAEESLLGAMLLSRDAIVAASEVGVSADDFYKPAHAHVYDAITSLYSAGEPADPVTVGEELRRAGLLVDVGGPGLLVSLQVRTPATSSAARYARIVSEHALLRRLISVAGEIAEMGYRVPDDVAEAVDRAEALVFDVAQHRVSDTMAPIRDLLDHSLTRLEALYEKGDSITGVPTGYQGLDELLSGLQPSSLVIVGARPATGKTSFALGMAAHAALEANRPVLFFSLEMSHLEITQRLLAAEARVDSSRLRNGKLAESDWTKISHAIGRLAEAPLYIDDNPRATVLEIRAKSRRLKSRLGDLGIVVVDYLQLMTGRNSAENRQVEVSEISRGLKVLARELQTPVVALSQLSRNLELRADKRPMLSDLRESGCLTAHARVLRADTGAEVTMGELFRSAERDIPVWTVASDLTLVPGTMTHVFATGVKQAYELRLASGRRIYATANHRFLAVDGWRRLDELAIGTPVAVPRGVPAPPQRTSPLVLAGGHVSRHRDVLDEDLGAVGWDPVVALHPHGEEPVYDATVIGTHNFIANGMVVHNSLEQDADVVMFLYRDELYHPESPDRGTCEVHVAKHRAGPNGTDRLAFLGTRFANMARGF